MERDPSIRVGLAKEEALSWEVYLWQSGFRGVWAGFSRIPDALLSIGWVFFSGPGDLSCGQGDLLVKGSDCGRPPSGEGAHPWDGNLGGND